MNKLLRCAFVLAALCVAPIPALAQGCMADQNGKVVCGPPDSSCAPNQRGEILCTTSGGGMMADQYGEQLCGPGYCVRDQSGKVFCSSEPRGGASVNQDGQAVCTGGCVPGRKEACVRPAK